MGDAFCRIHVDIKVRLQHENKHNNLFKEIPELSHLIITRQYKKYKASVKRELMSSGNKMINGIRGIDINKKIRHHSHNNGHSTSSGHSRHKSKRRKNKRRSKSYHRNKYSKKRNHSLGRPLF